MKGKKIKLSKIIHYLLITICLASILLDVREIVSAAIDTESYHFGHELFWYYKSLGVYVFWCVLNILYFLFAIFVSFLAREWKRAVILFLFLLSYAIITFIEIYA